MKTMRAMLSLVFLAPIVVSARRAHHHDDHGQLHQEIDNNGRIWWTHQVEREEEEPEAYISGEDGSYERAHATYKTRHSYNSKPLLGKGFFGALMALDAMLDQHLEAMQDAERGAPTPLKRADATVWVCEGDAPAKQAGGLSKKVGDAWKWVASPGYTRWTHSSHCWLISGYT